MESTTRSEWSSGLCDCFLDCSSCCLTFWCPCITFGRIANIVDQGAASCCGAGCFYLLLDILIGSGCCYSCFYRSKLRIDYNLKNSCGCPDFIVHCFCEYCALCQEYRELKARGFDLSAGWEGNFNRQNKGVAMTALGAPVVEGGMKR